MYIHGSSALAANTARNNLFKNMVRIDAHSGGILFGANILSLVFRVLEALEDGLLAMEEADVALGLRDELATVIRMLHVRLGLDEGGVG
jgi:hypothetical protein